MPTPYDNILTSVGLLEPSPAGNKLTQAAKDSYKLEVLALLATGNANGKGGSPATKIFNALFPLPPIPGPVIPNVTTLKVENLFWFEPDPIAALMTATLTEDNCPTWFTIFPNLLYEKTAMALDMPGTTPLFPIFDVSFPFGFDLPIPFALPDLAKKAGLALPKLMIKLPTLLKLPPSLPSIPLPPIPPGLPDLVLKLPAPPLILLDLLIGLIKLPFDLLLKLVLPPDLGIVLDLPGLPGLVLKLAFDIVVNLLVSLGLLLIVPKLFVASLLIYLKNVVAMVCVDIVGSLLGAGNIAKGIAGLTGLVSA